MRLAPRRPPLREGERVWCAACKKWVGEALADLDGPPFTTYLCTECQKAGRVTGE